MENNSKRVILIGTLGRGKTTLFNRLTGAQEKAKQGGKSTTRNIVQGYSQKEKNYESFQVIDAPGLGSDEDKMQHIAGILAALKSSLIHRIIFVIRHERNDQMAKQIRSIFRFLKNYKYNITIYISYFDTFTENAQTEKQLIQTKIQNEFNINSFIYNEKQSDASIIQQINQILVTSKPVHVQFTIEEIINSFDIFDIPSDHEFQIDDGKMITKFRNQAYQPIQLFIEDFPKKLNDPLYLNYLEELQNFAKQKVEEYLQQCIW